MDIAIGSVSISTNKSVKLSSDVTHPIIKTLDLARAPFDEATGNRYELYDLMVQSDPEIFGAITGMANIMSGMYGGVYVESGKKLDNDEEELLKTIKRLERRYQLYDVFAAIAYHLIKHGDCILLKKSLQFVPIERVTILERLDQINQGGSGKTDDPSNVFGENINWYVLNEGTEKEQRFKAHEIIHISIHNKGVAMTDVKGRWTYNVYSISPLETLVPDAYWKRMVRINDIQWRYRNVPREHHKLDFAQVTLDNFTGTKEQRMTAADAYITNQLTAYKDEIKKKEVDQGYVSTKAVTIEYVEPKTTTYVDPNKTLDQVNLSISNATRYPASLLSGPRKGYASEYIVSGTLAIDAKHIAMKIKQGLEEWMRYKIKEVFNRNISEDLLEKAMMKINLVLNYEKEGLARQIAVIAATGCFYTNEIRAMWGFDPVEEELNKLVEIKGPDRSMTEIAEKVGTRKAIGPQPTTPGSKQEQSET